MLVSIATNVSIFRITAIVSRGFFHFGFMDFIFHGCPHSANVTFL